MGSYAKAIAAVGTAGLIAAQNVIPMSGAAHGWVTVALAVLGAVTVYQVPNASAPVSSTRSASRHQVGE